MGFRADADSAASEGNFYLQANVEYQDKDFEKNAGKSVGEGTKSALKGKVNQEVDEWYTNRVGVLSEQMDKTIPKADAQQNANFLQKSFAYEGAKKAYGEVTVSSKATKILDKIRYKLQSRLVKSGRGTTDVMKQAGKLKSSLSAHREVLDNVESQLVDPSKKGFAYKKTIGKQTFSFTSLNDLRQAKANLEKKFSELEGKTITNPQERRIAEKVLRETKALINEYELVIAVAEEREDVGLPLEKGDTQLDRVGKLADAMDSTKALRERADQMPDGPKKSALLQFANLSENNVRTKASSSKGLKLSSGEKSTLIKHARTDRGKTRIGTKGPSLNAEKLAISINNNPTENANLLGKMLANALHFGDKKALQDAGNLLALLQMNPETKLALEGLLKENPALAKLYGEFKEQHGQAIGLEGGGKSPEMAQANFNFLRDCLQNRATDVTEKARLLGSMCAIAKASGLEVDQEIADAANEVRGLQEGQPKKYPLSLKDNSICYIARMNAGDAEAGNELMTLVQNNVKELMGLKEDSELHPGLGAALSGFLTDSVNNYEPSMKGGVGEFQKEYDQMSGQLRDLAGLLDGGVLGGEGPKMSSPLKVKSGELKEKRDAFLLEEISKQSKAVITENGIGAKGEMMGNLESVLDHVSTHADYNGLRTDSGYRDAIQTASTAFVSYTELVASDSSTIEDLLPIQQRLEKFAHSSNVQGEHKVACGNELARVNQLISVKRAGIVKTSKDTLEGIDMLDSKDKKLLKDVLDGNVVASKNMGTKSPAKRVQQRLNVLIKHLEKHPESARETLKLIHDVTVSFANQLEPGKEQSAWFSKQATMMAEHADKHPKSAASVKGALNRLSEEFGPEILDNVKNLAGIEFSAKTSRIPLPELTAPFQEPDTKNMGALEASGKRMEAYIDHANAHPEDAEAVMAYIEKVIQEVQTRSEWDLSPYVKHQFLRANPNFRIAAAKLFTSSGKTELSRSLFLVPQYTSESFENVGQHKTPIKELDQKMQELGANRAGELQVAIKALKEEGVDDPEMGKSVEYFDGKGDLRESYLALVKKLDEAKGRAEKAYIAMRSAKEGDDFQSLMDEQSKADKEFNEVKTEIFEYTSHMNTITKGLYKQGTEGLRSSAEIIGGLTAEIDSLEKVKETISTEITYVKNMLNYRDSLQSFLDGDLRSYKPKDIKEAREALLSVNELLAKSEELLEALSVVGGQEDADVVQQFISRWDYSLTHVLAPEDASIFGKYAHSYSTSLLDNPIMQALGNQKVGAKQEEIKHIYINPVQRPPRYEMLTKEIYKMLPPDQVDELPGINSVVKNELKLPLVGGVNEFVRRPIF